MAEGLDGESFDVVVVGTGLTESVLAAALSLSGKTVLHLDKEEYYGQNEATFTLDDFLVWAEKHKSEEIGDEEYKVTQVDELNEDISLHARRFNIDLSARLVLCRGKTVEALIDSGVHRYVSFHSVDDALALYGNSSTQQVLRVPCSKAEVFKSKTLTMVEKRQLMKFLRFCMDRATRLKAGGDKDAVLWRNENGLDQGRSLPRPQNKEVKTLYDGEESLDDLSFAEFVEKNCKMSPRLLSLLSYTIALLRDENELESESAANVMEKIQTYLNGLGRFGNTAFLYPLYGVAELVQAFCRLSAVHGGLYVLREKVDSVVTDTEGKEKICKGVRLSSGSVVNANWVVGNGLTDSTQVSELKECRLVCIVNAPLATICSESDNAKSILKFSALENHPVGVRSASPGARCLMIIPPNTFSNSHAIYVLQLDGGVEAAPTGLYVIHITTMASDANVLETYMHIVLEDARLKLQASRGIPSNVGDSGLASKNDINVLWKSAFHRNLTKPSDEENVRNLIDTSNNSDVVMEVTCNQYMEKAKKIFEKIAPEDEFLKKPESKELAPNMNTYNESDRMAEILERVTIPQPVDLTYFLWLGGRLQN